MISEEDGTLLRELLGSGAPWLEWAGKREAHEFVVDPVALHIHERVSTQAVLSTLRREDVQRDLFADPQQPLRDAVRFYEHDVDWSNRMILGDSLQVMASLAHREDLAGKVQMIYMDPPYGIRFASNFQPEIGRRDVKDKEQDLTREPGMVKAYRDTWTLGVHSYLAYLRDRLVLARELLTDSGSIFVQISDENLHRVRMVMDEVFGAENFLSVVSVRKSGMMMGGLLKDAAYYLVWYCRSRQSIKYRQLFLSKEAGIGAGSMYSVLESPDGTETRTLTQAGDDSVKVPTGWRAHRLMTLATGGYRPNTTITYEYNGKAYHPGNDRCWRTTRPGLDRLARAGRIEPTRSTLNYKAYLDDFAAVELTNIWTDTGTGGSEGKIYAVQERVRQTSLRDGGAAEGCVAWWR